MAMVGELVEMECWGRLPPWQECKLDVVVDKSCVDQLLLLKESFCQYECVGRAFPGYTAAVVPKLPLASSALVQWPSQLDHG